MAIAQQLQQDIHGTSYLQLSAHVIKLCQAAQQVQQAYIHDIASDMCPFSNNLSGAGLHTQHC
jgi:hypothetical protein